MTRGGEAASGVAWRRVLLPTAASAALVLASLVATTPEGWAQVRIQNAQRRPATSFPTAMRLTPSAREALRRWLCPNGGAPAPGAPGRCDSLRREARNAVAPSSGDVEGWFRDLTPARGRQAACPDGFKATLARGHADVTRCLPG